MKTRIIDAINKRVDELIEAKIWTEMVNLKEENNGNTTVVLIDEDGIRSYMENIRKIFLRLADEAFTQKDERDAVTVLYFRIKDSWNVIKDIDENHIGSVLFGVVMLPLMSSDEEHPPGLLVELLRSFPKPEIKSMERQFKDHLIELCEDINKRDERTELQDELARNYRAWDKGDCSFGGLLVLYGNYLVKKQEAADHGSYKPESD